ncbi:MAG: sodium-dependent bicarbonate transport family permease [Actinomycetota bacterium]
MSLADLVQDNLTSPAVLAFALGFLAIRVHGNLRLPEQIATFLSTYLLLAIGIKGGLRLREAVLADMWAPVLTTLALGVITPLVTFVVARKFLRFEHANAASLAAHFGSVSAVTFTAAETFARSAGTLEEGFLPALVAILEIPGIVIALLLASRHSASSKMKDAIHEVLTGKSILLLIGGLVIGSLGAETAVAKVEPFFVDLFPGLLCLFLLDLGSLAAERFSEVRRAGIRLIAVAITLPVIFGSIGVVLGHASGLSTGGAMVLGIMAASASYIAAPAAVRVALPEADLGLSLGVAIGVTFPFNLIVGIPLLSEISELLS